MRPHWIAPLLLFCACDRDESVTYASRFPKDDELAREISGRVRRGDELVDGATVRVTASPGFQSDRFLAGGNVVTDESGFFRFREGPIRYDLTVRFDDEVEQFRGFVYRGTDLALGTPQTPRAFSSKITIGFDPIPTHPVAILVNGDGVYGATFEPGVGITVATRGFQQSVTVHAVEYDRTLLRPLATGQVDLVVSAGVATTPIGCKLVPVPDDRQTVTVRADAPADVSLGDVALAITYGGILQRQEVATFPVGKPFSFGWIPGARYTYHVRATRGAAVSDSGYIDIPHGAAESVAKLYEFPVTEPVTDGTFTAHTDGVREHAFTPQSGTGTTVRVVSADDGVTLPDVLPVAAPPPHGLYRWTVTSYPTVDIVEHLAGPEARVTLPFASSAPVGVAIP